MNNIETFLKELGITKDGYYDEDIYVIPLDDSDEFAKMYSILDKSDKVELDDEFIGIDKTNSMLLYISDKYEVKLVSNFDSDDYRIEIRDLDR